MATGTDTASRPNRKEGYRKFIQAIVGKQVLLVTTGPTPFVSFVYKLIRDYHFIEGRSGLQHIRISNRTCFVTHCDKIAHGCMANDLLKARQVIGFCFGTISPNRTAEGVTTTPRRSGLKQYIALVFCLPMSVVQQSGQISFGSGLSYVVIHFFQEMS